MSFGNVYTIKADKNCHVLCTKQTGMLEKEKKTMLEIVATDIVANQPLKRQPTGFPTTHANLLCFDTIEIIIVESKISVQLWTTARGLERAIPFAGQEEVLGI